VHRGCYNIAILLQYCNKGMPLRLLSTNFLSKFQIKRLSLYLGASILILAFSLCWLYGDASVYGHKKLRQFLTKRLVKAKALPDASNIASPKPHHAIYVLGGSQTCLKKKFQTAADLYKHRNGIRIFVLSVPGITQYDLVRGRNLTNDEWAIDRLVDLGVRKAEIEPVSLERGFWGTFAEAKGISALVNMRGYMGLILVTSPYHTMRTWLTFSRFLRPYDMELYIYPSNDDTNVRGLLLEYVKLVIYEHILIPVYFMMLRD